MHTTVAKVFGYGGGGDGCGVLPEDADEYEDGGDEDESQCYLADWTTREGLNIDFGTSNFVFFCVPSGKGCEEDKAYKC
jgi:hypothetical protein